MNALLQSQSNPPLQIFSIYVGGLRNKFCGPDFEDLIKI